MPSKNPVTGKRLSGAEQKAKAAQRRAESVKTMALTKRQQSPQGRPDDADGTPVPVPLAFLDVAEPPYAAGVAAIEKWAAGVNLRAVVAGETADDEEGLRVLAVVELCRQMGKIRAKAGDAERVMKLRELRLFVPARVDVDSPPLDDAVAVVVWSLYKLAQMTYRAARAQEWRLEPRFGSMIKALAVAGFLPCLAEHEDVVRRVETDKS